jgi:hypothetical protein
MSKRISVILGEAPRHPIFSRRTVAPTEESGSATVQSVERGPVARSFRPTLQGAST